MSTNRESKWVGVFVYWFILLGIAAPALISEPDTFAVILGCVLLLVSAYLTYRFVRSEITHEQPEAPPTSEEKK